MPIGRPSLYTPELAKLICDKIAMGIPLAHICRVDGMPTESTVRGWAVDDYQGFYAMYARSRRILAEHYIDEIMDISDDGTNDWVARQSTSEKGGGVEDGKVLNQDHLQRSKLRVDTRKWFASKVFPKVYGDKVQYSGDPDGSPIEIKWKS